MESITFTFTRLYLSVVSGLQWAAARLVPARQPVLVRTTRRGAGLIEYALLAALAVLLFVAIKGVLDGNIAGPFRDVIDNITGG
jgi:Flp pilus assembly pilin Flp